MHFKRYQFRKLALYPRISSPMYKTAYVSDLENELKRVRNVLGTKVELSKKKLQQLVDSAKGLEDNFEVDVKSMMYVI